MILNKLKRFDSVRVNFYYNSIRLGSIFLSNHIIETPTNNILHDVSPQPPPRKKAYLQECALLAHVHIYQQIIILLNFSSFSKNSIQFDSASWTPRKGYDKERKRN